MMNHYFELILFNEPWMFMRLPTEHIVSFINCTELFIWIIVSDEVMSSSLLIILFEIIIFDSVELVHKLLWMIHSHIELIWWAQAQ